MNRAGLEPATTGLKGRARDALHYGSYWNLPARPARCKAAPCVRTQAARHAGRRQNSLPHPNCQRSSRFDPVAMPARLPQQPWCPTRDSKPAGHCIESIGQTKSPGTLRYNPGFGVRSVGTLTSKISPGSRLGVSAHGRHCAQSRRHVSPELGRRLAGRRTQTRAPCAWRRGSGHSTLNV